MKYYAYKILLGFLKGLLFIKRGIVRFGRLFLPFFSFFGSFYKKTLGFRLFKIQFYLQKKISKFKIPRDNRFVEVITSRVLLQFVFFIIVVVLAIPQSKLYTAGFSSSSPSQTILFSLIGPGNQDFDPLDAQISVILPSTGRINSDMAWNNGAVGANELGILPAGSSDTEDIASISTGGEALVKHSIILGTVSSSNDIAASKNNTIINSEKRTKATQYEVRSGDVVGSIASRFNIKIATLLSANNLSARSYIRPGDILKIPPGDGASYSVRRGDTIGKIAREFGVEQSAVVSFNNLQKDGASLSIGQELFIPGAQVSKSSETAIAIAPSKITETLRKIAAPPPSIEAPAGSGYVWPTKDHGINQYYGFRHTGVDIHGVIGNPNYAVKDGTVIKSQCGWNGGYGCYIILDHGGGITSLYGHNTKLLVSVGDDVKQGQVIGLLGSTGRSTGPHLHFEIRVGGKRTNPMQYIR